MSTRLLPGIHVSHHVLAATIVLVLATVLVLMSATQAHAVSGQLLRESRYNGPGNGTDIGFAIAADRYGYIYATGDLSTAVHNKDMITIKYRPSGTKLWARRWNGLYNRQDGGTDIAVDAMRNVYVVGDTFDGSSYNIVTVKYDKSGTKKWAKSYNGPGSAVDYAVQVAVDSDGDIYVGGVATSAGLSKGFVVIKYRPSGVRSWAKHYSGGSTNSEMFAMTLDDDENVVATGSSANTAGNTDFLTVEYSPAGAKRWARRWDRGQARDEQAESLVSDSRGNVYVTGYGYNAVDHDAVIVKYSARGTFRWFDRFDRGPGDDVIHAAAIGPDDCPVLAGEARNSSGNDDGLLMKYSPDGNQIWKKFYDGNIGPAGHDWFGDVFVDGSGNVFATGSSVGFSANYDYITTRYTREGVKKWARRYDGSGNDHDAARAVLKVPGGVFVTGGSPGFGSMDDVVTLKYQP